MVSSAIKNGAKLQMLAKQKEKARKEGRKDTM